MAQALNKWGDARFDADDQKRFEDFMSSLRVLLESWWQMTRKRRPDADPASFEPLVDERSV